MQYKAIKLQQEKIYIIGEDVFLDFVIQDETGLILSSLTGFTFTGKLDSGIDSVTLSGATYFSTSGSKLTVTLPNADTAELSDNIEYRLQLRGTLSSKYYYLGSYELWFKESLVQN